MAAASPLLAPDDDGVVAGALLRRVVHSLSSADLLLLELLEKVQRIAVDDLPAREISTDLFSLLWMGHFGLFAVDVDPADRVYLVRRPEGKAAIDERYGRTSEPKERKRRKHQRRSVGSR